MLWKERRNMDIDRRGYNKKTMALKQKTNKQTKTSVIAKYKNQPRREWVSNDGREVILRMSSYHSFF